MLHEIGDGQIPRADRAYDSDALRTACTENLYWRPPFGNRSIKADTGSRSRPTGGFAASIHALTSAGEPVILPLTRATIATGKSISALAVVAAILEVAFVAVAIGRN